MLAWQRTVYICFFGAFLSALGLSQLAPLLPIYMNELGVTTTNETAYWSGLAMGHHIFSRRISFSLLGPLSRP